LEAGVIKSKVETTWQDASACWKDDYATRFSVAVIAELKDILDRIRNTSEQLNEAVNSAISSLREFNN
jgi:hypothetical protein